MNVLEQLPVTELKAVQYSTGESLGRTPQQSWVYLHHLVLPKKDGYWVRHKNGNNLDCRSANLEYITPKESALQRPLSLVKEEESVKKITEALYREIKARPEDRATLAKEYGLSGSTIGRIQVNDTLEQFIEISARGGYKHPDSQVELERKVKVTEQKFARTKALLKIPDVKLDAVARATELSTKTISKIKNSDSYADYIGKPKEVIPNTDDQLQALMVNIATTLVRVENYLKQLTEGK